MPEREFLNTACTMRIIFIISLHFSMLCLSSCITVEGQSSGEMKRQMEKSFLFRSTDMFYPDGVPDDPDALPELDKKQVKQIAEVLELFLKGVEQAHSNHHEDLSYMFQRDLKESFNANLVVVNEGAPISQVDPSGEITIDVKIAQAFYRCKKGVKIQVQDGSLKATAIVFS